MITLSTLQYELVTDAGRFRGDFAWIARGVIGEFDGKVKYGRLLQTGETPSDVAWRERQRELAIERAGWDVVRFAWADVHDVDRVRARLLQAFERRPERGALPA